MMVEAGANEVPEEVILDGIMFAHEEIKKIVTFIEQITAEVGKPKRELPAHEIPQELENAVRDYETAAMREAIQIHDKTGARKKWMRWRRRRRKNSWRSIRNPEEISTMC